MTGDGRRVTGDDKKKPTHNTHTGNVHCSRLCCFAMGRVETCHCQGWHVAHTNTQDTRPRGSGLLTSRRVCVVMSFHRCRTDTGRAADPLTIRRSCGWGRVVTSGSKTKRKIRPGGGGRGGGLVLNQTDNKQRERGASTPLRPCMLGRAEREGRGERRWRGEVEEASWLTNLRGACGHGLLGSGILLRLEGLTQLP